MDGDSVMTVKVLGLSDATECECCGKKNLSVAVELRLEGGEVVHYGRDCAAKVIYGRKSKKNAEIIVNEATALTKIQPVVVAVTAMVEAGADREEVLTTGNSLAQKLFINGMPVSVNGGFASWGCYHINWNGGMVKVEMKKA
jgi:hypothetical protein